MIWLTVDHDKLKNLAILVTDKSSSKCFSIISFLTCSLITVFLLRFEGLEDSAEIDSFVGEFVADILIIIVIQ
jgi:hypothetical protein